MTYLSTPKLAAIQARNIDNSKKVSSKQQDGDASKTKELKPRLLDNANVDARLSSFDFCVLYRLLAHYSHETKKCYPSVEWLAEALHASERNVKRAIKQLEATGWIYIKHRFQASNLYTFNWDRAVTIDLNNPKKDRSAKSVTPKECQILHQGVPNQVNRSAKSGTSKGDKDGTLTSESLTSEITPEINTQGVRERTVKEEHSNKDSFAAVEDTNPHADDSQDQSPESKTVPETFSHAQDDSLGSLKDSLSYAMDDSPSSFTDQDNGMPQAGAENVTGSFSRSQPIGVHQSSGPDTLSYQDADAVFAKFWDGYPYKAGKDDARVVWHELIQDGQIKKGSLADMREALRTYRKKVDGKNPRYILHADKWLLKWKTWKKSLRTAQPQQTTTLVDKKDRLENMR
jgi:hypothetical protein